MGPRPWRSQGHRIQDSTGRDVCLVLARMNDAEEAEHKSVLMAAPALLAACQAMKAVRNVHSFSPDEIDRKKRAWDKLEAAIAAATSPEPSRGEGGKA